MTTLDIEDLKIINKFIEVSDITVYAFIRDYMQLNIKESFIKGDKGIIVGEKLQDNSIVNYKIKFDKRTVNYLSLYI